MGLACGADACAVPVNSLTPEFCSFCSLFSLCFSFVHSLVLLFVAGSF